MYIIYKISLFIDCLTTISRRYNATIKTHVIYQIT